MKANRCHKTLLPALEENPPESDLPFNQSMLIAPDPLSFLIFFLDIQAFYH